MLNDMFPFQFDKNLPHAPENARLNPAFWRFGLNVDKRTKQKPLPRPAQAGRGLGRGDLNLKVIGLLTPPLSSFGEEREKTMRVSR